MRRDPGRASAAGLRRGVPRRDRAHAGPGEGAGLGLSIARGIIEAHCGQIAVRNAGRGCQFVIRLPLASAAPEPADRGQLAQ